VFPDFLDLLKGDFDSKQNGISEQQNRYWLWQKASKRTLSFPKNIIKFIWMINFTEFDA
jgi:hypothetical protein